MDPNANLDQQLDAVKAIRHEQNLNGVADMHDVERLCELVEALDHWLAGGGFLPERWRLARDPRLRGTRP